jgi:hypothetical protein
MCTTGAKRMRVAIVHVCRSLEISDQQCDATKEVQFECEMTVCFYVVSISGILTLHVLRDTYVAQKQCSC